MVGGILVIAAYTASASTNSDEPGARGYSSRSISGVVAESVSYDTAGASITAARLVLTGDTRGVTIKVGFNDSAPRSCSAEGTYHESVDDTTYVCALSEPIASAEAFVLVAG